MKDEKPMGARWNDTKYPKNYQLYRRVEDVADQLEKRRSMGHVALRAHIVELNDIAIQLKIMDTGKK